MAEDSYGQGITLPALTDQPSIATVAAALEMILSKAVLSFTSASTRNAAIPSPVEGMTAWLQDANVMTQYDGTAWVPVLSGGAWAAYTPAWTATTTNPVLGGGELIGRYSQTGKTVDFSIKLTTASNTAYGSGSWAMSLPVPAASGIDRIGSVMVGDASGTNLYSFGAAYIPAGGTTVGMYAGGLRDGNLLSSVHPQTWAGGDRLWVTGRYEAA